MNRPVFYVVTLVFSAMVYALFLHGVMDELLTLVAYCGRECGYPFPWTGPLQFYLAEEWIDGIIDASVVGMIISAVQLVRLYK